MTKPTNYCECGALKQVRSARCKKCNSRYVGDLLKETNRERFSPDKSDKALVQLNKNYLSKPIIQRAQQ